MNYPLNCWYVIATSDEVGRSLLARQALGRRLLLFRTGDGQATVFDDRCPHRAAPLSMGTLQGDQVVCAYHGFSYAPDGQCVRVPSQANVPYGAQVRSYPVLERPPFVWVWPGNPARSRGTEPPDLPSLREPGWTIVGGAREMAVNYLLLHDNALDRTHFPYVHPHRIHRGYVQDPPPLRIEVSETTVSYSRTFPPAPLIGWQHDATGLPADREYVQRETGTFVSPAMHVDEMDIIGPDQRVYRGVFIRAFTPVDADRTLIIWRGARDSAPGPRPPARGLRRHHDRGPAPAGSDPGHHRGSGRLPGQRRRRRRRDPRLPDRRGPARRGKGRPPPPPLGRSVSRGSAVDVVRRAGDPARDVRGEEDGHRRDLLDGADPLQRGLLGEHVDHLLEGQPHLLGALRPGRHQHVGPHQPRADRVAGDARRAVLLGDRLGQADHGVLARHVRGDGGLAVLALHRGDHDDPAELLRDHVLQRLAAGPERRVQVPLDRVVPVLVGQVRHRRGLDQAAGVVDQDVDLAEAFDRPGHHAVDVLADGDVTPDEVAAVPGVHLLQRLLALLGVPAVDHDAGALREEGLADAPSDPGAPAGDDRHPAVKFPHAGPP